MARQKPNSGEHIAEIISRTACVGHAAPLGTACYYVHYDLRGGLGAAVCGSRITKAGFNGEINPNSLSRKAPEGKTLRVRTSARRP